MDSIPPESSSQSLDLSTGAESTFTTSMIDMTVQSSSVPSMDQLYLKERLVPINTVPLKEILPQSTVLQWLHNQMKRFGTRNLIISSLVASCFLLFLCFIIIRFHCTTRSSSSSSSSRRQPARSPPKHNQSNGKAYSQLHQQAKRCSVAPPDGQDSKKRVPRLLRYLHTKDSKPASFRLTNNAGDSYHLISSLQDNRSLRYRNSDCVLNEHCCIHSSLSQPLSSSSSIYHQVNHLMLSGDDPPLPMANLAQPHAPPSTGTLRSIKKDLDNSSSQTYSAVYSCDLASNLDMDQKRLSVKRRSILKNAHSSVAIQAKVLFLYAKNLVDCFALQPAMKTKSPPILLAIADENRIQLFHALVSDQVAALLTDRSFVRSSPAAFILNCPFRPWARAITCSSRATLTISSVCSTRSPRTSTRTR